jgi:succinoglycan biosynthesis protein ExoL
LLVVSSPAFLENYFQPRHGGRFRAFLAENRLPPGFAYGPRPDAEPARQEAARLAIGWFGVLRCQRSLSLLLALADSNPSVRIVMRGYPSLSDIPDFVAQVGRRPNVELGGRYRWPDDLAAIYDSVDLVWAGDFHDPGANSRWLLPNRLYEGGYYGAPPLAPQESQTGRWIDAHGFGFTLAEPLEQTLLAFVAALQRDSIVAARAAMLRAPTETFVQPPAEMRALLEAALSDS